MQCRAVRRLLIALLIACASLAATTPVVARPHIELLRADPGEGAVLSQAPRQVRLWFSTQITSGAITLADAHERTIALAQSRTELYQPAAVGLDQQFDAAFLFVCQLNPGALPGVIVVDLPQLDSGTYQLRWGATPASGGQELAGMLTFRVQAGAAEPLAPTAPQPHSQQSRDLLLTLTVSPNLPGQNFVTLTAASTRRPEPAPIRRVLIALTPPDGAPATVVAAQPTADGTYQLGSDIFTTPGAWRIGVTVERASLPDAHADFAWSLPLLQRNASTWSIRPVLGLTIALVVALLGGVWLLWRVLRRRMPSRLQGALSTHITTPTTRKP